MSRRGRSPRRSDPPGPNIAAICGPPLLLTVPRARCSLIRKLAYQKQHGQSTLVGCVQPVVIKFLPAVTFHFTIIMCFTVVTIIICFTVVTIIICFTVVTTIICFTVVTTIICFTVVTNMFYCCY